MTSFKVRRRLSTLAVMVGGGSVCVKRLGRAAVCGTCLCSVWSPMLQVRGEWSGLNGLLQVEIGRETQDEQKSVNQQLTGIDILFCEFGRKTSCKTQENVVPFPLVSSFSNATQWFEFWLFLLLCLGWRLSPCLYSLSAHVYRKCLLTMVAQIVCDGTVAGIVCMQMKGSCSPLQWEQCLK